MKNQALRCLEHPRFISPGGIPGCHLNSISGTFLGLPQTIIVYYGQSRPLNVGVPFECLRYDTAADHHAVDRWSKLRTVHKKPISMLSNRYVRQIHILEERPKRIFMSSPAQIPTDLQSGSRADREAPLMTKTSESSSFTLCIRRFQHFISWDF